MGDPEPKRESRVSEKPDPLSEGGISFQPDRRVLTSVQPVLVDTGDLGVWDFDLPEEVADNDAIAGSDDGLQWEAGRGQQQRAENRSDRETDSWPASVRVPA